MANLELSFASKEESLSVRTFSIREGMNALFEVEVVARSEVEDIDFESIVGKGAAFKVEPGIAHALIPARVWSGVCSHFEQLQAEASGLSTYLVRIVPALYRTTLRRNSRIFQHVSIPEIVLKVLADFQIEPVLKIDQGKYPKHEYRVQYEETDYAFISRMLEEAGIAFYFSHGEGKSGGMGQDLTRLVLADKPQLGEARPTLVWVDNPSQSAENEFVSKLAIVQRMRPGRYTIRDFDFRTRPDFQLIAESRSGTPEDHYEQYRYAPGAFVVEPGKGGDTPVADDKGIARVDEKESSALAKRSLEAARRDRRVVRFHTNAVDICPGIVFTVGHHPKKDLAPDKKLLVVASTFEGSHGGEWVTTGEAVFAEGQYRPSKDTPRPRVVGVQSAMVVGPAGEEIHTDEFGRVRVQFHWDREGRYDDGSSCWVRVSQAWAGSSYGSMLIPRVGHEVLVDFFDGDPDRPVVVGRVYNNTTRVPYKLPDNKTKSGWKSDSSPGSNGFNEISFEDKKGREVIHIQAQKDLSAVIKDSESVVIGNSRGVQIAKNDALTIGESQIVNIDVSRAAIIGESDATDVGKSHSVTVASGTGTAITDKQIIVTTGTATVILHGGDIALHANGNIQITAGGTLVMSGREVFIDGGPMVNINCSRAGTPGPMTIPEAKKPSKPGGGGESSDPAYKLKGKGNVERPEGFEDVEVSATPPALDQIVAVPPASPAAAPPALSIGGPAAQAIQQAVSASGAGGVLQKAALIKNDLTQAIELYKLVKGESLASLPSTMQVFGPVLTQPIAGLGGLRGHDVAGLVNAGNQAGIFHLGAAGARVSQAIAGMPPAAMSGPASIGAQGQAFHGGAQPFMALRTEDAPQRVDGAVLEAQTHALARAGAPPDKALAAAMSNQGIALYAGDSQGNFDKVTA